MQDVAASWNILTHPATSCSMMQHVAASCNILQQPAKSLVQHQPCREHGTCNLAPRNNLQHATHNLQRAYRHDSLHFKRQPHLCRAAGNVARHRRASRGLPGDADADREVPPPSTHGYPVGTAEHSWVPCGYGRALVSTPRHPARCAAARRTARRRRDGAAASASPTTRAARCVRQDGPASPGLDGASESGQSAAVPSQRCWRAMRRGA